jgi:hypothetical protein
MLEQVRLFFRKKFLPPKPLSSGLEVEMLVRNHQFKQLYKNWVGKGFHQELLKNIYTSFTLSKLSIRGDLPLHFYTSPAQSEILFHYIDTIGKPTFSYLQDYFRDRIVRLGYQVYLSERKVVERMGYHSITERHLLKPNLLHHRFDEKVEQLYGNIEIAVHYADDRPVYMSIRSETLSDSHYRKPFPFDELAEILLT